MTDTSTHLANGSRIVARAPVTQLMQPCEAVSCDLLDFKKVNEDAGYGRWVLHFFGATPAMNHVYMLPNKMPNKSEEVLLNILQSFYAYTESRWNQPVRIIQTNGETRFGATTQHGSQRDFNSTDYPLIRYYWMVPLSDLGRGGGDNQHSQSPYD
jgi:hypothetical protein